MDRKSFDERQIDQLLSVTLISDAEPDALTVMALKRQLQQKQAKGKGLSLWWLPALFGTAVSASLLYVLSFVADWKCITAALVAGLLFVLSAWLLTIIGILKLKSFKEAFKLI